MEVAMEFMLNALTLLGFASLIIIAAGLIIGFTVILIMMLLGEL